MANSKSRSKVVAVLAIALLVAVGAAGYTGYKRVKNNAAITTSPSPTNSTNNTANPSSASQALKPATIGTADFTYDKPEGWAKLSKDLLDSSEATSGIGRAAQPTASFMVKISSDTPSDLAELNSATLTELKKLPEFNLITSNDTKIDGKSGQIFTYSFINQKETIKQDMVVVVHKQKTFFLLSSAIVADFDKQEGDFSAILASFKFK